jgi:hypothetical protein
MSRRANLVAGLVLLCGVSAAAQPPATAGDAPRRVTVFKSATCDCCKKWIAHMTAAGFVVDAKDVTDLAQAKEAHHVPAAVRTCHTALLDGYVIEGHVPADVVARLLREHPAVDGIGVPGMPNGSPGMESPRPPEHYKVLAFRDGKTSVFAER